MSRLNANPLPVLQVSERHLVLIQCWLSVITLTEQVCFGLLTSSHSKSSEGMHFWLPSWKEEKHNWEKFSKIMLPRSSSLRHITWLLALQFVYKVPLTISFGPTSFLCTFNIPSKVTVKMKMFMIMVYYKGKSIFGSWKMHFLVKDRGNYSRKQPHSFYCSREMKHTAYSPCVVAPKLTRNYSTITLKVSMCDRKQSQLGNLPVQPQPAPKRPWEPTFQNNQSFSGASGCITHRVWITPWSLLETILKRSRLSVQTVFLHVNNRVTAKKKKREKKKLCCCCCWLLMPLAALPSENHTQQSEQTGHKAEAQHAPFFPLPVKKEKKKVF